MARPMLRHTVVWAYAEADDLHVATYLLPTHHLDREAAKQRNAEASAEDQAGVLEYTAACAAGRAVVMGVETVEVAG